MLSAKIFFRLFYNIRENGAETLFSERIVEKKKKEFWVYFFRRISIMAAKTIMMITMTAIIT